MSEYQMPPPNKVNSPQPGNGDEETIDLLELLYALLGKWREIAAATVACALIAAIGVLFFVTPKYQASSTIYVISQKDSDINMSDLQIGTALTDDYIQVFHMWEVQEKVISNLDLPYTYSQLDKMLSVTNASNTRMVEITVTSESAQEAADIANEYVTVGAGLHCQKDGNGQDLYHVHSTGSYGAGQPEQDQKHPAGSIAGLCGQCGCRCCDHSAGRYLQDGGGHQEIHRAGDDGGDPAGKER
mgnify:CR=1 FL=1